MPLYEVVTKGQEAKRLIEAASHADALRHCSHGMFNSRTITKPADIAALMGAGVKLETAGVYPEPEAAKADDDKPTFRVNVETGMNERRPNDSDDWASEGPASLDDLVAALPEGAIRVNIESGMVQRDTTNGNAETEEHWADIREATPEEIDAVKAKMEAVIEPAPKKGAAKS